MIGKRGLYLGERFVLVNRLAHGRFGELWRGADRVPSRQIAVRLLPPAEANDTIARQLARIASIHQTHVARILDVGRTPDGGVWIAGELLLGETLATLLARRRAIPAGTALRLVSEIATVVAEAHALGVAHGCLAPHAVVLHRDAHGGYTPKLVDFGRALFVGRRPEIRVDVHDLRELLLDCVGRDRSDPRISTIFDACLPDASDAIGSAAAFAQRTRVAANACSAGLGALERMVRVPLELLESARMGVINHLPTFPGLGAAQASRPEDEEPEGDVEHAVSMPAIPVPPAPPPDPSSVDVEDEMFVDFRRPPNRSFAFGPRHVAVSCIAVLALAFVGARTPKKLEAPRIEAASAARALPPETRPVETEPAKPVKTEPPKTEPPKTEPPKTVKTEPPKTPKTEPVKSVAKPEKHPEATVAGGSAIPSNAGIPLWEPHKVAADDNPYQ